MKKISEQSWFKYVIIFVLLLVPFMYSFFYLKAYWNPYGEGNMDNIPVAIVNLDDGKRGDIFASKLIESNKLDFNVVSLDDANKGLSEKKYYAVITIPSDFSSNIESASNDEKVPATITYSPNQKTNYLASQIISRVLVVAEEEARGEVSSTVVDSLSEKLSEIPDKMNQLSDGIDKLSEGAGTLNDGINILNDKYLTFNSGINQLYKGSSDLNNGIDQIDGALDSLSVGSNNLENGVKQINDVLSNTDLSGLGNLVNGINSLNGALNSDNGLVNGVNNYVNGVNSLSSGIVSLNDNIDLMITKYRSDLDLCSDDLTRSQLIGAISALEQIKASINSPSSNLVGGANQLSQLGSSLVDGVNAVGSGVDVLESSSSDISRLESGINGLKENLIAVEAGTSSLNDGVFKISNGFDSLSNGSKTLNNGLYTLNNNSVLISNALGELSNGSGILYNGVNTLKASVNDSVSSSKSDLSKLNGLSDFVGHSVVIDEEPVNSIDSYGTAFGPFFMSIALWVGSLMLFIILYYDASDRFKLLSRNASNKYLRTCCYLGLACLQGVSLGLLLMLGLDLHITNYFLYFISMILVACLFESIMEFLIVSFGDLGKFISLILLVLQLAAAGGTFPIQTVTKSFRFLNPLLPMKYSCDLFKESIITIEGTLLFKSIVVIFISFIIIFILNLINDRRLSESK